MSTLKLAIGAKIKAARTAADLTQEELAGQVKRSAESISNIERGLHLPTIETLFEISRALKISPSELLDIREPHANLSSKRLALEARLQEILKILSDHKLSIAIEQIESLTKFREK